MSFTPVRPNGLALEDKQDVIPLQIHDSRRQSRWIRPLYLLLGAVTAVLLWGTFGGFPQGACLDLPSGLDSADTHMILVHRRDLKPSIVKRGSGVTTDIMVYPPVLVPSTVSGDVEEFTNGTSNVQTKVKTKAGTKVVTQTLMVHEFASSYYVPFVGNYTPPKIDFNRVTFSFSVNISGVQFDRLGSVWFGDTELWRTTTAEPTTDGVTWTYVKDMSPFLSLFQKKQTLIFSLNNVYNSEYNGAFFTSLTATFFTSEDTIDPADEIIPISARIGDTLQPSIWSVPSDYANNTIEIPRRTRKAIFTIAATGQGAEEFWYTNLLTYNENDFGAGAFYGYSPFREIQLYIDNELAGVAWPYPNIFTGGINPGLWRPIVGIDTFDLRENEIDITPWLPLLCDGRKHTFSIKIAGVSSASGNGKGEVTDGVGSYWLVSGKIFLWLDPAGSITTGTVVTYSAVKPYVTVSSFVDTDTSGNNETLNYSVDVARTFSIKSSVTTANGTSSAAWHQELSYSNEGHVFLYGYGQTNIQSTVGTDKSSSGYARSISYPLYVTETVGVTDGQLSSLVATVNRTQIIQITGEPVFPTGLQSFDSAANGYPLSQASTLSTTQDATSAYIVNVTTGDYVIYGTTTQEETFSGNSVEATSSNSSFPTITGSQELYSRYVEAVNQTIIMDMESLIGEVTVDIARPVVVPVAPEVANIAEVVRVIGKGRTVV